MVSALILKEFLKGRKKEDQALVRERRQGLEVHWGRLSPEGSAGIAVSTA